jgi:hypothetical protein
MSITSGNRDVNQQVDREYAKAWRYQPDDKLVGEVVELSQRDGAYGTYPIVTVRKDDGSELAFHAFHTVAQNELARARPQVGERIAIKYVGVASGADGRSSYHRYRVAVDRPAAAFNWGAFGAAEAEVDPDIPSSFDDLKGDEDDRIPF